MFIVALFILAKGQKQPKYLSINKWVNVVDPYEGMLFDSRTNNTDTHG